MKKPAMGQRMYAFLLAGGLLSIGLTPAQARSPAAGQGAAQGATTFNANCAECHGGGAAGNVGPPLNGPYMFGGDEQSVADSIRHGFPPNMPPFDKNLSEAQIK